MLKPKCGFYLKVISPTEVSVEIYDLELLKRSLDTSEFFEYCKDLGKLYKMKPEDIEGLVYLNLFMDKAKRLKFSPEELIDKLKSLGLRIEKVPEDQ